MWVCYNKECSGDIYRSCIIHVWSFNRKLNTIYYMLLDEITLTNNLYLNNAFEERIYIVSAVSPRGICLYENVIMGGSFLP